MWNIAKRILFSFDAEQAHDLAMRFLKLTGNLAAPVYQKHPQELWGLRFPNPLGLAAGFDKNGECLLAWQQLGFGFVEVGTVTAKGQPGNPKPRMFRLLQDRALMNRLGFNNTGAAQVARNLEKQRLDRRLKIPIGVNIGKSKVTPMELAAQDYRESFVQLADLADYVVINVSSPNTPGLRELQQKEALMPLLEMLSDENQRRSFRKPLLLKLAPDLHKEDALQCAQTAVHFGLDGLVVSNTTISRAGLVGPIPEGLGGISGAPLFARSTQMLADLRKEFANKLKMIGVGGIMDPATAQEKWNAGADLLQVYTGFIYGGPFFTKKILGHLDVK